MSFLEAKDSFPLSFASILSAIKLNFFVLSKLKYYILWSKATHQSANFWDFSVLGSKFVRFVMSVLKLQVNSSFSLASFFIAMTNNCPLNFKLISFLLWIKKFNQSPNFETFKYSCGNFPNPSCHLWKQKSVLFKFFKNISIISLQNVEFSLTYMFHHVLLENFLNLRCSHWIYMQWIYGFLLMPMFANQNSR